MPGVRRIAVLRADGVGDLVLAVPALDALRATYPDAETTVLTGPAQAELLRDRPGPWERALVVPPYPGVRDEPGADTSSREVLGFLAAQRARAYDVALQLHGGGAHSTPLVTALGARVTAGARADGAPPLDRALPYVAGRPEVPRLLELVGLVGATPVGLEPRLVVTEGDRAAARSALAGAGVGAEPLVAVHPGARDPVRRWAPERFAAVAAALAERGARLVLVGSGPDDRAAAAAIAASRPVALGPHGPLGPLDLVDRLGLGALLGVLERCRLLVGTDSGPRHLALAVGTPTVGVFLAANRATAGPLVGLDRHLVAVAPEGRGVDAVPVEPVRAAALALWAARGSGGRR